MLSAKAFANAVAVVTAVFYLVCWVLSTVAPDLVIGIAKSWVHSLSLEVLKSASAISPETGLIGIITISALAWVTTYATIWLYNKLAKK